MIEAERDFILASVMLLFLSSETDCFRQVYWLKN